MVTSSLVQRNAAGIAEVKVNVKAILPELNAHVAEAEEARDAAPEAIQLLEDAGVYQLTRPPEHGGLGASLDDRFDVLALIAQVDPSLSWMTTIHIETMWAAGTIPDELQDEIFSEPNVRLCGVVAPTGKATPVDGGYTLTGRWDFNTGARHASWIMLATRTTDASGEPELVTCLVRRSDVVSLDTWDPFGMAGTGSFTTVVEDLFVPTERVLRFASLAPGEIASERHAGDPYYLELRYQHLASSFAGSMVGTAQGAMAAFLDRLPGRGITYTDWKDQREAPLTHAQVGRAQLDIEGAELYARRMFAALEHGASGMSLQERARTRAYTGRIAQLTRSAVQELFEASGASAIQRRVPIQRYFREISAMALHGLTQPTTATELYGRVLVGLPPNSNAL